MTPEPVPLLDVVVYGKVIQQGSKKGFRRGKGVQIVDDNKDTLEPWRAEIVRRIGPPVRPPFRGPVRAVVEFALQPPQKIPADRLGWPSIDPDLDKYIRAAGDALTTSQVIHDDGQIVEWTARKIYVGHPLCRLARPGMWLRLYEVLDTRQAL